MIPTTKVGNFANTFMAANLKMTENMFFAIPFLRINIKTYVTTGLSRPENAIVISK